MRMRKGKMTHINIKKRPLTLKDVIGWVEDLEKRIDRMEKLLAERGIEERQG